MKKNLLTCLFLLCITPCLRGQVRLLAPVETGTAAGLPVTLRWQNTSSAVSLQFSTDDGNNWVLIADSVWAQSYNWHKPDKANGRVLVRVVESAVKPHTSRITILQHPGTPVRECNLNGDGTRCRTRDENDSVYLWDIPNNRILESHYAGAPFSGYDNLSFLTANDDYYLARSTSQMAPDSYHYMTDVRRTSTGKILLTLPGYNNGACISFSDDAGRCLSGNQLWDMETLRLICTIPGVKSPWLWPGGQLIAGVITEPDLYGGHEFGLWNIHDGHLIRTYQGSPLIGMGTENETCFSPDSALFLLETNRGVCVVRTGTGDIAGWLQTSDAFTWFQFLQNNTCLATLGRNGRLRLWDLRTFRMIADWGRTAQYASLPIVLAGSNRVLVNYSYGRYKLFDTRTGRGIAALNCGWNIHDIEPCGHVSECMASTEWNDRVCRNSTDSHIIISPECHGNRNMYPMLFDARTGRRIAILHGVDNAVFSANGQYVVAETYDSLNPMTDDVVMSWFKLIEAHTGNVVARMGATHHSRQWESEDCDWMLMGTGKNCFLWDINAGRAQWRLQHAADVVAAEHADGRLLTMDANGSVYLWEVSTGRQVALLVHDGAEKMYLSATGCYAAVYSQSDQNTTPQWQFWDAADGTLILTDGRKWDEWFPEFCEHAQKFGAGTGTNRYVVYHLGSMIPASVKSADTIAITVNRGSPVHTDTPPTPVMPAEHPVITEPSAPTPPGTTPGLSLQHHPEDPAIVSEP